MAKILLYDKVPQPWFDAFAEFLRTRQPDDLDLELVQPSDDALDSLFDLLPQADVIVVGLTGQRRAVVRHVFEETRGLKLLQKLGSRAFGVDVAAARDRGVPVSLLPLPAHVACAEHTMLLILAAAKKLLAAHRAAVEAKPDVEPRTTSATGYAYNWTGLDGIGLLAGKTLGLVGMGDIAVEVARRASAFGMDVIYWQDDPIPETEAEQLGVAYRPLDDLLAHAHVVSLHAAHTPRTEKLINAERIALMNSSAILVNTSRGGLVEERALISALADDLIAGAALDVFEQEPTPRDNPLLALDNVVATPHIASGTLPREAIFSTILPNLLAALRGEPIEGLLEPVPAEKIAVDTDLWIKPAGPTRIIRAAFLDDEPPTELQPPTRRALKRRIHPGQVAPLRERARRRRDRLAAATARPGPPRRRKRGGHAAPPRRAPRRRSR